MTDEELTPHPLGQGSTPASLGDTKRPDTYADLAKRVAALEAKPKRVPPPPRKPLPWPRAARDIAWIAAGTAVIVALIVLVMVATVMVNLPLAIQ